MQYIELYYKTIQVQGLSCKGSALGVSENVTKKPMYIQLYKQIQEVKTEDPLTSVMNATAI